MKPKSMSIINSLTFTATILFRLKASILSINDYTTSDLSSKFTNTFMPIDITLSIWSIVYLLTLAFTTYQIKISFTTKAIVVRKVGWWFAIANLSNIAWILTWHYLHLTLTAFLVSINLFSIIIIYRRLGINYYSNLISRGSKIYAWIPFSVYLAWIILSSFTKYIAVFNYYHIIDNPQLKIFLSTISILSLGLLTIYMIVKKRDYYFALVMLWGYIGLTISNIIFSNHIAIILSLSLCIIVIIMFITLIMIKQYKLRKNEL